VARVLALSLAFLSSAAMWWLYFDYVARIAERRLELAANRTELARDAYTYLHVLMIAGVIVAAVGDELLIAHPTGRLNGTEVAALAAGPGLYLAAHVLFRLRMTGTVSVARSAGTLACLVVGLAGTYLPALVVAALLLAVLVGVIAREHVNAARRRSRGEPTPLERLEMAHSGEPG
jgi:low temperature requirement protein LtrA